MLSKFNYICRKMKTIFSSLFTTILIAFSTVSCTSDDNTTGNKSLSNTEWILAGEYSIAKDMSIIRETQIHQCPEILIFKEENGLTRQYFNNKDKCDDYSEGEIITTVKSNILTLQYKNGSDIFKGTIYPKENVIRIRFNSKILHIHNPTDPMIEVDYDDLMMEYKKITN